MNLVQVQHPKWWRGGHGMDTRGPRGTGLGRTWPLRTTDHEDAPINVSNNVIGRTHGTSMSDQK